MVLQRSWWRLFENISCNSMLWLGHIITTRLYFGRLSIKQSVASIAPDLPMALLGVQWRNWSEIHETHMYAIFYRIPHSLLAALLVPREYRQIYIFHILMDILSHTGRWSIQPLYPLEYQVHGIWDPIEWQ